MTIGTFHDLLVFVILALNLVFVFALVLEVLQFGRDANVAESWLAGQEPLVRAAELGANVDEVESLIKRHEAFEKLAAAWEERFVQLEKLTTVCTMISIPLKSGCQLSLVFLKDFLIEMFSNSGKWPDRFRMLLTSFKTAN